MVDYVIVTPATTDPVALADVVAWCRADAYDEATSGIIASLIPAARELVEVHSNRTLMATTYLASLECFPGGLHAWRLLHGDGQYPDRPFLRGRQRTLDERTIFVPRPPLQSVASITYVDEAGTTQTLDPGDYIVDTVREPGRIVPAYDKSWPATRFQPGAVQIQYVAGYASTAAVPAAAITAIKQLVSYWVTNPDAAGAPLNEQPLATRTLVASFAVPLVH